MSFNGLHVVAGYLGGAARQSWNGSIIALAIWSETLTEAGTTTHSAPNLSDLNIAADPVFDIFATSDSWVAVGPSPDPANGPRYHVEASTHLRVFAKPGDFVSWIAA